METASQICCPFVYANGKRCAGHVYHARAYGPRVEGGIHIRKVRLWCSEKEDHQGTARSALTKDRMEFYPNELPADIQHRVLTLFDKGASDVFV